jgi:hypothetical protein
MINLIILRNSLKAKKDSRLSDDVLVTLKLSSFKETMAFVSLMYVVGSQTKLAENSSSRTSVISSLLLYISPRTNCQSFLLVNYPR